MKRIYSFMFAAVAAFAAASCAQELENAQLPAGEAKVYTATVDGTETKAALNGKSTNWENNDAILIDVRTPEEYEAGHLEGAINIELTKIIRSPELLPQDKRSHLIVYCAGGPRSRQAHYELRNMGYFNVYDLGDMNDTSDRL